MYLNTARRMFSVPVAGVLLLGCSGGDGSGQTTPPPERPRPKVAPAMMQPAARTRPAPAPRRRAEPPPKRRQAQTFRVVKALDSAQLAKHVAGSNVFAAKLYDRLRRHKKGNLFFSPFSVASALAMVRAGAAGKSLRQLAKLMRIKLPEEAVHRGFNQQLVALNGSANSADNVRVANSLWGRLGARFGLKFLARTRDYYGAIARTVDFRLDAAGAARQINTWVAKQTKNLIKRVADKHSFTHDTLLVLINAIYFKADWKSKFDKSNTTSKPFFMDHRRRRHVMADMMYQLTKVSYYKKGRLRIGIIPYLNTNYSMVVLTYRGRLSRLESRLRKGRLLAKLLKKARPQNVELHLPRFQFSTKYPLKRILATMGIGDLFTTSANLDPAAPGHKMYLNRVLHKAYINVDEEGTIAAAVTMVELEDNGNDHHPTLRCDAPFLFFIRHNPTGLILFAGRVSNPNPEAKVIGKRPRKRKRRPPRPRRHMAEDS